MIAISIENLIKTFGGNVAISGISLRVEPGELFFLLGPSGCGKTTLLRSIAGFSMPDRGRILFDDEDVTHLPAHKRNTGMMFQSYALWPHLTVAQNVAFGLVERKVPRAEIDRRVSEALGSVRMEALASRKIAQLSGGQQQRIALARALVVRPRALLLDEPLSNLDARLRIEMRTEIRRICKESGLTAIYVTHDQKEALSISDRMAILENGRLAQVGDPASVYRRPASKVVANFIGETNFIDGTIIDVAEGYASVETALGLFRGVISDAAWRPGPGESATLSIRPESWRIEITHALRNSVPGRIGEFLYLGEVAQYQFHTTGGGVLCIFELNPHLSRRSTDRDFFATVDPDDVVVLKV